MVASAGVTFGEKTGWFGAVKVRYFSPRPLIDDNSLTSSAMPLVNGRIGYNFDNCRCGWEASTCSTPGK